MRAIIRRASASSGRRLINQGATTFQSKVLSNSGTVVEIANALGRLSHSEAYREEGCRVSIRVDRADQIAFKEDVHDQLGRRKGRGNRIAALFEKRRDVQTQSLGCSERCS